MWETRAAAGVRSALLVVMLVATMAPSLLQSASAGAELASRPRNFWGVDGLEANSGPKIAKSEVWAIEQIGNTMYVGGRFLEVTGGGERASQPFLAAFHADTGQWIDWWRPQLDDVVWTLQASEDGRRLFVGGRFNQVNSIDKPGLVALDPATGEIDPTWSVSLGGGTTTVRTLHLDTDDWLYIAGDFTLVRRGNSALRVGNITRVRPDNGRIATGWKPSVQGGTVYSIDADPRRNRVYLAGLFTSVNGSDDAKYFAILDRRTSSLAPVANPFPLPSPEGRYLSGFQHSVIAAGNKVWVAGVEHTLYVFNAGDLSVHGWHYAGQAGGGDGGDFQALERNGGRIYASCHCGVDMRSSYTGGINGTRTPIRFAAAFSARTGRRQLSYTADFAGAAGPWAIKAHSTDGCVWFGGDMTQADGEPARSLARQCHEDGPGPAAGPALVDRAASAVQLTFCKIRRNGNTTRITWNRAPNDNAKSFVVRRSKDGGDYYWTAQRFAPARAWGDVDPEPGRYRYSVEVRAANGTTALRACGPARGVLIPE